VGNTQQRMHGPLPDAASPNSALYAPSRPPPKKSSPSSNWRQPQPEELLSVADHRHKRQGEQRGDGGQRRAGHACMGQGGAQGEGERCRRWAGEGRLSVGGEWFLLGSALGSVCSKCDDQLQVAVALNVNPNRNITQLITVFCTDKRRRRRFVWGRWWRLQL